MCVILFKKKSVINFTAVLIFTAVLTSVTLFFQWAEFYKGYSLSDFNLKISIDFLVLWVAFSFYWGFGNNKMYKKFFIIYSLIGIIAAFLNCIFYSTAAAKLLYPFHILYDGTLFGFVDVFDIIAMKLSISTMKMTVMLLIISPLLLVACSCGYKIGRYFGENKRKQFS